MPSSCTHFVLINFGCKVNAYLQNFTPKPDKINYNKAIGLDGTIHPLF